MTALDRVVHAETKKCNDEAYEAFKADVEESLSEEQLPMTVKEFNKTTKRLVKKHQSILQRQLAPILSFKEILDES